MGIDSNHSIETANLIYVSLDAMQRYRSNGSSLRTRLVAVATNVGAMQHFAAGLALPFMDGPTIFVEG